MSGPFEQQMEELKSDMREMRGAITKMAEALTKLSVLEERNLATNQTIERLVYRVEKVEEKAASVELAHAKFEATTEGITKTMRVMWAAFGSGVLYIGSQVFQMIRTAG